LPVKRAPKLAKALQSPYAIEVQQIKPQGNVLVFEKYNQSADDCDVGDFQNWFQRGYKPHNKFERYLLLLNPLQIRLAAFNQ
jgi:hypothetical protein